MVTPDVSSLGLEKTELKQWKESKRSDAICTGTRHKATGKVHGIVRLTSQNGVFETAMRQGVWHGLSREIWHDRVKICVASAKQGIVAGLVFDRNFEELSRMDPQGFLDGMRPEDFRRE